METKIHEVVKKCYMEILGREADEMGFMHYSELLEKNKITVDELKNTLKSSVEFKVLQWRNNIYSTQNPPEGNFCIKEGYWHRVKSVYFKDKTVDPQIAGQPYVYELTRFLGNQISCQNIIDIGCGNALKLSKFYPNFNIIGIDFESNIEECKKKFDFGEWINFNLENEKNVDISQEVLKKSIIVCADAIEHLKNPSNLLANLFKMLEHAPLCIISTPERSLINSKEELGPPQHVFHIREWEIQEFEELLKQYKFSVKFIGLTDRTRKDPTKVTIVACIVNPKCENPKDIFVRKYPNPEHFKFYKIENT